MGRKPNEKQEKKIVKGTRRHHSRSGTGKYKTKSTKMNMASGRSSSNKIGKKR